MIFKCRWLYSWKFYVLFFNYSWGIPPHTHHDVCSLYRMLFLKMTLATSLEPMLSARYSKQSVYKHHLIQSAKWLYTGSNSHSILGIAKLRPRGFIKSLKGIIFQSVLCFFSLITHLYLYIDLLLKAISLNLYFLYLEDFKISPNLKYISKVSSLPYIY